ncbi:MAG: hypothetical protein WCR42_06575 [bacterium]
MGINKSYESKAKDFNWLGWAIIGFTALLVIMKTDFFTKGSILMALGGLVLGGLVGVFFILYGNRVRKIVLTDTGIKYFNPKLDFSVRYQDMILIKSFQDIKKTTSELVILTEDKSYSVASTFYDKTKLIQCFRDLCEIAKDYPQIKIEDDRLWLEEFE